VVLDPAFAEVESVRARTSCIGFCRDTADLLTSGCNIILGAFVESRLDGDDLWRRGNARPVNSWKIRDKRESLVCLVLLEYMLEILWNEGYRTLWILCHMLLTFNS
jgi:hypothetical protein